MYAILLSINPIHVDSILNGSKGYEFRKVQCKKKVSKIIIYSTSPVMKIVGEADIEIVLKRSPEDIWKITSEQAGVDKKFFDDYYKGKDFAIAYKLRNVKKYTKVKSLSDYGLISAPQSFAYVNQD